MKVQQSNDMKTFFWLLIIGVSIPVIDGTKSFIREYTYTASEADSKINARAIALDQVKRILLEEIGVYIHSEMNITKEEKNNYYNELTTKQIESITAGITETKILEEKWNGEIYYIKASITVDPDEVTNNIARISVDKKRLKELEEAKRKADDAVIEINRLREELVKAKSEKEKLEKQKEYNTASNILSATDWIQQGYNAVRQENYLIAVMYFDKAIQLDSEDAYAFKGRGEAKYFLDNLSDAISDFTKAINLSPDFADAYNCRGTAKELKWEYIGADNDYTSAIKLDSNNWYYYYCRGNLRRHIGKNQEAIVDYTEAIRCKPEEAISYVQRGRSYLELNQKRKALSDFLIGRRFGYENLQDEIDKCK